MGAQREDTDPSPKRGGTEAGLGTTPATAAALSPPAPAADTTPGAVDFDALHAALGDPLDLEEVPEAAAESSGRSNAMYASTRPHSVQPSYTPVEDLHATPAVIVAAEDTLPGGPPEMTLPVTQANLHSGQTPQSGIPFVTSGPARRGGHAQSAPPPARSGYPRTPPAFHPQSPAQMTMRMPDRPVHPRRGKTPTVVVRARGPSAKQKLVAFMAMLMLVTACGIAVIIWRKPRWLGLDPTLPLLPTSAAAATAVAPPEPSAPTAAVTAPVVGTATTASTLVAASSASAASPALSASVPPASPSVRVLRPRPPVVASPPLPVPHGSAPR